MPKPVSKPIIAVDVDDVLTPHFQGLIDWYNQEYDTKLTLAHNHPTDPKPWGTDSFDEAICRAQRFLTTPQFEGQLPYKEAVVALSKLSARYILVVLTARDTIVEKISRDWLKNHFKDLIAEAHFTAQYNLEGKSRNKGDVAAEIGARYLIDDSFRNCAEAAERGLTGLLYGDYPWNQGETPKGVVRVKDWQEVLEFFESEPAG